MAALLVVCVARHTALVAPCPAPQINPHLPHTDTQSALAIMHHLIQRLRRSGADDDARPKQGGMNRGSFRFDMTCTQPEIRGP
jgi:hypothetical protein